MNRRQFLGSFAYTSTGILFNDTKKIFNTPASIQNGVRILQGFTDETTTQFTVDVPQNMTVHYEAVDRQTGNTYEPCYVTSASRRLSNVRVDQVAFKDLYLGAGFFLFVKDNKNEIVDVRAFNMLDTNKAEVRIAVLSCMFDANDNHEEMWNLVFETSPDMLFLIGDVVYGDILGYFHGPNVLWSRYIETRQKLGLYGAKNLIPTIAIWDDHDFGLNDADGTYTHKENSLKTFHQFYAQKTMGSAYHNGPGVASSFAAFGHKFIFLDNRFWRRLPNKFSKEGFLGDAQMEWLERELVHDQKQTWVIQGSQTFGEFKEKSGTYNFIAPNELDHLLGEIRRADKPTVFLSGDVHFSELNVVPNKHLGYESYELTSSCLHSIYLDRLPKNSQRIVGATKENFLLLNITSADPNIDVICYGRGRKRHFDKNLFSV